MYFRVFTFISIGILIQACSSKAPIVGSAPEISIPPAVEEPSYPTESTGLSVNLATAPEPVKDPKINEPSKTFNILPLLRIEPTLISHSANNQEKDQYIGAYTRFYVENQKLSTNGKGSLGVDENSSKSAMRNCDQSNNERCYADEHQSWIKRLFVEKQISRVMSLKIQLQNPNVETTTTLASSGYSTKQKNKGESWTTEFNGNLFLTPYFRIDGGSVARIESRINATSSSESQVSNTAFAIVQNGISLATPVSTLLTSYVAPDLTQSAKIMDGAITSLFSNELAEISVNEFPQITWFKSDSPEYSVAAVTGWFPSAHNMTDRNLYKIGSWNIKTTSPVASVFNPKSINSGFSLLESSKLALEHTTPSQILNFPITKDLTLKKVLQTDDAVTNALKMIKDSAASDDSYKSLCTSIDEKAQAIGLNKYDAAALLWAFSHDSMLTIKQGEKLLNAKCLPTQLVSQLGLNNK